MVIFLLRNLMAHQITWTWWEFRQTMFLSLQPSICSPYVCHGYGSNGVCIWCYSRHHLTECFEWNRFNVMKYINNIIILPQNLRIIMYLFNMLEDSTSTKISYHLRMTNFAWTLAQKSKQKFESYLFIIRAGRKHFLIFC